MSGSDLWNVVFVLGPPGSGKGTQCQRISDEFGFKHLSAGDLLRIERSREGSQFGQMIETHMKNGTIVPVEVTCKLLENAMIESVPRPPGFLIDGFPRNENNLQGWEKEMGHKTKLSFVLFITCDEDICLKRCLNRGQNRPDDNEESLKKRIHTYVGQTMPIIQLYEKQKLVRQVDGARSADEVFHEIRGIFADAGFKSIL